MTGAQKSGADAAGGRGPRVFAPDDPSIVADADHLPDEDSAGLAGVPQPSASSKSASVGGLFLSAVTALAGLALTVSFANFVSTALARDDWVGWTATSLLIVAIASGAIIILRELLGLVRLSRLSRLKRDAETALRARDTALERKVVSELQSTLRGRRDLAWGLARLKEHQRDVRDAGDLMRLADRELMAPLDTAARRMVLKSAKRVSVVTAMSPMAWVAMLYVMIENLRLLRSLAGLYGGRPGTIGALRLARMVIGHIIATGGLAMTDDLLGQFLGQDLLRRLSRRLGEGAFNGAMTARIGTAAVAVTRPIPFIEAEPIRVRDLLPELFKRTGAGGGPV